MITKATMPTDLSFNRIYELHDLPEIAAALLASFPDARIFTFYGEVGAGKTTLISEVCRIMGVSDAASSPTFSIINEYVGIFDNQATTIYHIDLYRLHSLREALDVGIEDILEGDKNQYAFIEWATIIEPMLPSETVQVRIDTLLNHKRSLNATIG